MHEVCAGEESGSGGEAVMTAGSLKALNDSNSFCKGKAL